MKNHIRSLFLVFTSLVFLAACSKMEANPVNQNGDPIISDQFDPTQTTFPGGVPKFITLLKLQSPALLSSAQKQKDGAVVIDTKLKQQVIDEQQAIEIQLAQLSPDIRVIFRYRMVLNAIAIEAPQSLAAKINELKEVSFIEADERFEMPKTEVSPVSDAVARSLNDFNSMKIIGALDVKNSLTVKTDNGDVVPVRGQGMRVGVIDSGIDYTHRMFGGPGDASLYSTLNPSNSTAFFPNARIKGGKDFAGATFNPSSHIYSSKVPAPDDNPLDISGHGTHVAGTIAGQGDGVLTYDGAAPEAEIYALKVFGDKGGGTSDTLVIAALEFAADPNGDMNPDDYLHVVNLSLGGSYGKPHSLYNMAVGNLTRGGTLAVVSAGNDGPLKNIVSSPSTAEESLSVAASIDDMEQNWQFPAVEFKTTNHSQVLAQAVQGATTKPLEDAGNVTGKLVYLGTAVSDFSPEQLAALQGNVALMDRGEVSFDEKITRAVGAIGVVMVNNSDEEPIVMGGEKKFEIPGVMITKALGDLIKSEMALGDVVIQFVSTEKIKRPELIDTIVGFSSQGPRAIDSLIKPEITAPGYNIISAELGSGDKAVRMSGTSMSSPHVAGLAALLMQYRSELTPLEVKALLMNASVPIDDAVGNVYPISRQGAGRANVYTSALSPIVVETAAVSIGEVQVGAPLNLSRMLTLKNLSSEPVTVSLATVSHPSMTLEILESTVALKAFERRDISLSVNVMPLDEMTSELDGFVNVSIASQVVARVPVMAVVNYLTHITASFSPSSAGTTEIQLSNTGANSGTAYVFQLVGTDARKPVVQDTTLAHSCDLESVGSRLVQRGEETVLQFAVKIYNPVTDWNICDVNIEFDVDGDGVSDREIIGTTFETMPGLDELDIFGFKSMLFDSKLLTAIFDEYRKKIALQLPDRPELDYAPALLGVSQMITYDHSTLAIVEVPLLQLGNSGSLRVRATVSYNDGNIVEGYDSLQVADGEEWVPVKVRPELVIAEEYAISPMGAVAALLPDATLDWVAYFPRNAYITDLTGKDSQSKVISAGVSAPVP